MDRRERSHAPSRTPWCSLLEWELASPVILEGVLQNSRTDGCGPGWRHAASGGRARTGEHDRCSSFLAICTHKQLRFRTLPIAEYRAGIDEACSHPISSPPVGKQHSS